MHILLVFVFFVCSFSAFSQSNIQTWFPDKTLMQTGVYYYPEQWKKNQWERDFQNMARMGFEFTHYAEFAWSALEPEEGKYNFGWLDSAVSLAGKYGIKVILCTPTPCPPAWLTKKYPEILVQSADGVVMQHGSRQHGSWSSDVYRKYIDKLITLMAQRYGKNPNVWGWQLDNEPSHYGQEDYNAGSQEKFKTWAKNKYGTIQNLNDAWGADFWSVKYNSFDQLRIPNRRETPQGISPHAYVDAKRFQNDRIADFLSFQIKILRANISKDQFITTNYMGWFPQTDPWRNKDLDFASYTMYPAAGHANNKEDNDFRTGLFYTIPFASDFHRPIKGTTGVMELQIGQVNWGNISPRPFPGVIRAYYWNSFATGCSFSCSYRFRQPIYGYELYIEGMVGPDGYTPTVGGEEYVQSIKEMNLLRTKYNPNAKMPEEYLKRKTAILWSNDNYWDLEYQKLTNQWNSLNHMIKNYYVNVKQLNCPVDFIDETFDFSKYPVIIAPAYQLSNLKLIEKWKTFVQNGGNLILTCRTAQKDENGHLWEKPLQQPIYDLIGGKILYYDNIPDSKTANVKLGDKTYVWNNWADVVEPYKETKVLATYDKVFYAGKAAVTINQYGKGTVAFVGADTDSGEFELDVLKQIYSHAKIPTKELPYGVSLEWRLGFWVAINYSEKEITLDIPANATIHVGERVLKQAGVTVWSE